VTAKTDRKSYRAVRKTTRCVRKPGRSFKSNASASKRMARGTSGFHSMKPSHPGRADPLHDAFDRRGLAGPVSGSKCAGNAGRRTRCTTLSTGGTCRGRCQGRNAQATQAGGNAGGRARCTTFSTGGISLGRCQGRNAQATQAGGPVARRFRPAGPAGAAWRSTSLRQPSRSHA
jgi:hypothetical protein